MARKTINISCEEMVAKVTKEFIMGSDAAFLKKVKQTAKGGGLFNSMGKSLRNKSKTYSLYVLKPLFFFMKSKDVTLIDEVNKINYEMKPKKDWPKFYNAIMAAIAKTGK